MTDPKLPPGQQLVAADKWPFVGERTPRKSDAPWTLEITGSLQRPTIYSLEELFQLPSTDMTVDIHCVTRWSRLGMNFRGVLLETLIERAGVNPDAQFVSFVARSERNHSTSLSLKEAIELKTLIAHKLDDQILPSEHGGPIRSIVPGKYFYKSVKWLEKIEFLCEDRLGYWEADAGYHNNADPWHEERYMAATLNKRQARELLESKDFRGLDLRSIDASNRQLTRLLAAGALLRNADFRGSNLQFADFSQANLSNARFNNSNLQNVNFVASDLEGADLSGSDLRNADLSNSSLFGASFCQGDAGSSAFEEPAVIDSTTKIPAKASEFLTPIQIQFLQTRSPMWVE